MAAGDKFSGRDLATVSCVVYYSLHLFSFSVLSFFLCADIGGFQRGPGAARRQAVELGREGVEVRELTGRMGGWSVDFGEFGWFPDELPSEEAEGGEGEGEGESGSGSGSEG